LDENLNLVAGYLYSIGIGHIMIYFLAKRMHLSIQSDPDLQTHVEDEVIQFNKKWNRHPQFVGMIERALYTTAFIQGGSEFIGFWIALKAAGRWQIWKDTSFVGHGWTKGLQGRLVFNLFLISNGFSIAYAFIGANIINTFDPNLFFVNLTIPTVLILFTLLFVIWDWIKSDKKQTSDGGS